MASEKFTRQERLEIGRRIYEGELNRYKAAARYGISEYTARSYLRMYKASLEDEMMGADANDPAAEYLDMSKSELISELIKVRRELTNIRSHS